MPVWLRYLMSVALQSCAKWRLLALATPHIPNLDQYISAVCPGCPAGQIKVPPMMDMLIRQRVIPTLFPPHTDPQEI